MKPRKLFIIVNPLAGNGKARAFLPLIIEHLNQKKWTYEVVYTAYKGHATKIVREQVEKQQEDIHAIVAIGGDGTLHEIVNGMKTNCIPLGYIPAGSGNDFAREMGISRDPVLALQRVLNGKGKRIDIGIVNNQYFLNVVGMGFDGEVVQVANQSRLKKVLGKFIYLYGLIKTLFTYHPIQVKLTVDEEEYHFDGIWLIAAANHRFYGGGMKICPTAKNNDGILGLCIIKDLSPFQLLRLFPSIYSGKHINYPMVKRLEGKQIEIKANRKIAVQLDGEVMNEDYLNIRVLEKGIYVI